MNTEFDPGRIAQLLTQSTHRMDAQTLSALSRARQSALERHTSESPAYALAFAGRWSRRLAPSATMRWLAAGLLAATMVTVASYYHHAQEQQIGELDVAILTDELPLEVFVD